MMSVDKALRLARKWASGGVCTLREGEAQEYHQLCAEALERSRWIPVTESVPNEFNRVLCVGKKGGMFIGEIKIVYPRGEAWCYVPNARSGRMATHWMPLPNKPKED